MLSAAKGRTGLKPMSENPLFAAFLTPHRSLGLKGIRRVVAVYAVLAAIPGLYFFLSGAWPVIGFLGLDALVLYWALSASLKSGDAFEEVTLWSDRLEIRHVTARGREQNHRFNPFWVRLSVDRDHEDRVTRLALRNRCDEIEIGAFLNPADKASFAKVFGQALHRTRA
jgi:uncharacterized membrane protein